MVQVRQRLLALAAGVALLGEPLAARRFYDDDPLQREPTPVRVQKARQRRLNDYYDFFRNTFFMPGKEAVDNGATPPARGVNTLGEVIDGAWYRNRDPGRMSLAELARGPGNAQSPAMDAPWTITAGKSEGITPGVEIKDARGRQYLLKFDPLDYPELASAADAIGAHFFWALGYYTPQNYIVRFTRPQLKVGKDARFVDRRGTERDMTEGDVDALLRRVPHDGEGRYRALASLMLEGEPIGPFRFHGVRTDDPNDVVPHEDRRDLRGMHVFAAWLNHTDAKSLNTLDTIVEEKNTRYIRHHLIDFGAMLGSDSFTAKSPRAGHVYLFDFKPAAYQFLSLGLYIPDWQLADYPDIAGVGNFESEVFHPEEWKTNYPNPAFERRLPDDTFWAARKVMAFRDDQIRALVETGRFSDPRAVDWITRNLIARRDKIGRAYFDRVLPLDGFRTAGGRLEFEDLAVRHGFAPARRYTVAWSRFDNESERHVRLPGSGFELPPLLRTPGTYVSAEIGAGDPRKTVTIYMRNRGGRLEVVGIERKW